LNTQDLLEVLKHKGFACHTDSVMMVNIIVLNVLSFLTDGNGSNCVVNYWSDEDDGNDNNDNYEDDYSDEDNDRDEDDNDYEEGDGVGDGDLNWGDRTGNSII
jgi:hypothetical protein